LKTVDMKKLIPIEDRLIFALDVPTPHDAQAWVRRLGMYVNFYKVGLQLFLSGGFDIVEWILARGHKVMLDLKFFDVPATVSLAVKQVARFNVTFTTVHGYAPIVRASSRTKGEVGVLAVTLLTSFGKDELDEFAKGLSPEQIVLQRARSALENGADGVVCSGLEAAMLRRELGSDFFIVTPGIRPRITGVKQDDQRRIVTPGKAIKDGADYIVVGRPIRDAEDPIQVIRKIQSELEQAL